MALLLFCAWESFSVDYTREMRSLMQHGWGSGACSEAPRLRSQPWRRWGRSGREEDGGRLVGKTWVRWQHFFFDFLFPGGRNPSKRQLLQHKLRHYGRLPVRRARLRFGGS